MSIQEPTFSDVPSIASEDISEPDQLAEWIERGEVAVIRARRLNDGEEISLVVIVDSDNDRVRLIPIELGPV